MSIPKRSTGQYRWPRKPPRSRRVDPAPAPGGPLMPRLQLMRRIDARDKRQTLRHAFATSAKW